jgi:outer membrane protein assembly factor BamD
MIVWSRRSSRFFAPACALLLLCFTAACAGKKDAVPTGITEVDKFLYEKGTEALNKKRWYSSREYFQRLVDNYPQSPYRPDAKLGVGDSYLGEGTTESLTLGIAEFKEFLTFYPTHARADYAQYKLGLCHFRQMRAPQRDQTETRLAVEELQVFVEKYPNSDIIQEGQAKLREARDRLSTSEYQVGYFYYKARWYPGAIERLRALAKADPGFTRRDAVYFYLAESLMKVKLEAEALPYYDRITKEFDSSEFLARAKERLDAFHATPPPATNGAAGPPATEPAAPAASDGTAPAPAPASSSGASVSPPSPPPPQP